MSIEQRAISSPRADGVLPSSLAVPASAAQADVQVELYTVPPGLTEIGALPVHRIKVHAGAPVRGQCRNERFMSTRGNVDLFPAGMFDVWHVEQPDTSVLLTVSPDMLERAALEMGLRPGRANLDPRHQFRDPQLEHLAWALDAERRAGFPSGRLYTESLGLAVAANLLTYQPSARRPTSALSVRQLRQVTGYIEEHLDRDLSLAQLAEVAGLSQSHLKTVFRQSTGEPVHAYVMRRRVERARLLLEQGTLPQAQIALEAGFAHQSHMARWMRRLLGTTPRALAHGPATATARLEPSLI